MALVKEITSFLGKNLIGCQNRVLFSTSTAFQKSAKALSHEEQIKTQKERNIEAGALTELVRDFLDPNQFLESLQKIAQIGFFCGVPDSLLKDFCACVTSTVDSKSHIITSNEGSAIAMASGYHLSTGRHAMVYLQNSGLGNTVNPLMSLSAPEVYSIPMLLLIGWRGEPGKRDEPQHIVQGRYTPGLLAALGIPFQPLPDYQEGAEQALATAKQHMDTSKSPYALLVKRQTFLPYKLKRVINENYPHTREEAMKLIIDNLRNRDVVVSTTGMLSRELFEYRVNRSHGHEKDFLTVGSMGHASAIALGISLSKSKRQVFCLDGDGSVIMHMGNLATIGCNASDNMKHIIINNEAHDSVGGQLTDAANENFSFTTIAKGCGYKEAWIAVTKDEIIAGIEKMHKTPGPILMEIKVKLGSRKDVGRPTQSPIENKNDFMHFLGFN